MSEKLNAGDTLPDVGLKHIDGTAINLPADIDADFGIVLFYRGHW